MTSRWTICLLSLALAGAAHAQSAQTTTDDQSGSNSASPADHGAMSRPRPPAASQPGRAPMPTGSYPGAASGVAVPGSSNSGTTSTDPSDPTAPDNTNPPHAARASWLAVGQRHC